MARDLVGPSDENVKSILNGIDQEQKDKLEKVSAESKNIYDKSKKTTIIVGTILIGLSFLGLFVDTMVFVVALVFAIIITIAIYGAGQGKANTYFKKNVTDDLVKAVLGPKGNYQSNQGWTPTFISGIKLFRMGNIYSTKDRITGEIDGVDFVVADVTSGNKTVTYDSKGNRREHTTYYFQGVVAEYEFNSKKVHGSLEIREDEGGAGYSLIYGRKDNVDFEDIAFNKDFNVYTKDKLQAFYIMTPQFIEAFNEIKRRIPGHLIFSIQDGRMIVAINGTHNNLGYSAKSKDANSALESIIREILPYKWFVDILNLDQDFGQEAVREAKLASLKSKLDSETNKNGEESDSIINSIKEEL